ncbi:MAG: ATP-binding protein [Pseudomonadota bacterium]|nr:ATP-binding protein [Pseudomonadota bacterium]
MQAAPLPSCEPERLAVLRQLNLRELHAKLHLQRSTRLARKLAAAQSASIAFVDADVVWYSAPDGLEASDARRELTASAWVILQDDVFWVEDAREDARFCDGPLVLGPPYIRFFAAAPIVVGGQRIGCVTVIDKEPRAFAPDIAASLEDIAGLIADEIELSAARNRLELASRKALRATKRHQNLTNLLQEMIEGLPAGVALYDRNDALIAWNEQYTSSAGSYASHLKRGRSYRNLLERIVGDGGKPDIVGREEAWITERVLARKENRAGAHQQLQGDGRWFQVEDRKLSSGAIVSTVIEITDLKKREQSFKLLFENNPVPMVLVDSEAGAFIDVNAAACRQYGYDRDAFLQMRIFDILADDEKGAFITAMEGGLPGVYSAERVWKHLTRDAQELLIAPYVVAMTFEGRPALIGALIDVTQQTQVENELKATAEGLARARDAAESANLAKSEFLANMSHEIRTPLNGVVAMAEKLGTCALRPAEREMVDIIRTSGDALSHLLADILDSARIESGNLRIERVPFDLGQTVRSVSALYNLQAEAKGIALETSITSDLPAYVLGDPVRVRQVISNMVSNAVKFTDLGAVTLSVETGTGDDVVISVTDTGVGFDASQREKIFGRFQQADGTITRRFGGTGLGLAISTQLSELMDGSLDCESNAGSGSRFWVTLPLPSTTIGSVEEARQPAANINEDRPMRILLADDHPTNRKVVEIILAGTGVDLICVADGQQAVEQFEAAHFDVVLMDMQMPVMDGLTAVRKIRGLETEGRIPILMLTANALPEHIAAGQAAGADGHLSKPITASILFAALQEVAAAGHTDASVAA